MQSLKSNPSSAISAFHDAKGSPRTADITSEEIDLPLLLHLYSPAMLWCSCCCCGLHHALANMPMCTAEASALEALLP